MIIVPKLRTGALAIVLAAGMLAGCSTPPNGMVASQVSIVPAINPANTGPYSGDAWAAELDAAMTSDFGGE